MGSVMTAGRRNRGSVTLEYVIVFPILLLVFFVVIQAGLWFHHRGIALASAQEGARVAAAYTSSGTEGADAAQDFASRAGAKNVAVQVDRGGQTVTVTVEVGFPSLIPGLGAWPISQTATTPIEAIK